MADVVSLDKFKKQQRAEQGKRATLCGGGHHSWLLDKDSVFDVRLGKLVSRWHCKRCGAVKTAAK